VGGLVRLTTVTPAAAASPETRGYPGWRWWRCKRRSWPRRAALPARAAPTCAPL